MKYAFRCRNCGWLETSDFAGEAERPHACRVCGGGVSWKGTVRTFHPENWDILAEMTDEALSEFGLDKEKDVELHMAYPATKPWVAPKFIETFAEEKIASKDK